jgi:ribosomal protein L11 methyltransferase
VGTDLALPARVVNDELRRVVVRVGRDAREEAIAVLLELAPAGFEEVDRGAEVELAVYTDAAGEERLRISFSHARSTPVAPGWEDAWRAFHRPVRVGGLWVGPPWERPAASERAVVIEPGRAFGTGAHPTTRLCLELLAEVERGSLLDVGCGSGVLAIAATRLGYQPVVGIDVDPVAVEAAAVNAQVNHASVDVRVLDAIASPLPRADVAVANVSLAVVNRVLERLEARVAITSGYLERDRPRSRAWRSVIRRELDGWAADAFRRD